MANRRSSNDERAVIFGKPEKRPYGARLEFQVLHVGFLGDMENTTILLDSGAVASLAPARQTSWEGVLQPLPQVGFLGAAGKYEYFLPDDIPTQEWLKERGFNLKDQRSICGIAVDEATLRAKLAEKGIEFKHHGELVPPRKSQSILCEVEGTIDQQIFRAIAKIAFNYLLYWQRPEFLLEEPFNPLRRYIRYGETPGYTLVAVREKAILDDEPVAGERRLGHLITSNWAQDGISIVGQVSLFNWVTYCVSLLRDYSGERRDVKRGHFFDVSNRRIVELETRP